MNALSKKLFSSDINAKIVKNWYSYVFRFICFDVNILKKRLSTKIQGFTPKAKVLQNFLNKSMLFMLENVKQLYKKGSIPSQTRSGRMADYRFCDAQIYNSPKRI